MIGETEAETSSVCQFTCGEWMDEESAKKELDARIERLQDARLFNCYQEVTGFYNGLRLGCELKRPRIDRILAPHKRIIDRGWDYGCIGIECKTSGKKLGTIVAQCLDYGNATYELPQSHNRVALLWVFIWPLQHFVGDIASVMTQNRIGGAYGHGGTLLALKSATGNLLRIDNNKVIADEDIHIVKVASGNKTGSR